MGFIQLVTGLLTSAKSDTGVTGTDITGTKRGLDCVTYGTDGTPLIVNSNGRSGAVIYGTDDTALGINSEGRADVVLHAHPNNVNFHFVASGLTATQDFILVDISDTTNFKHTGTSYIHFEWLHLQTDATNSADYELSIGYLENVDGANGDFYEIGKISGTKTAGLAKDAVLAIYPNGARGISTNSVTSVKSLNDTAFQTDVNLASTLDPTTANTPSGSGDIVLRFIRTAGEVSVILSGSYHGH